MTLPPKGNGDNGAGSLTRALARVGKAKAAYTAGAGVVGAVGWPVILGVAAVVVVAALIGLFVLIAVTVRGNQDREQFAYQCESRLGYSVGDTAAIVVSSARVGAPEWETTALQPVTTTVTTPTSTTRVTATTTVTTTTGTTPSNPYASLSVPPTLDTKTAACASAVKDGPVVGPPITDPGGELGEQAAVAANEQVGLRSTVDGGTVDGPTEGSFSAANLVRYVYFRASGGVLELPSEIGEQIMVGERVDPQFVSPGDLVFYDFTATDGPVSVMIAISSTLGVDANAVEQAIRLAELPTGNVIIKRPILEAGT
ncbi:hypothetical protein ACRCUN_23435 [Mycobacterium sp. LTG2003]